MKNKQIKFLLTITLFHAIQVTPIPVQQISLKNFIKKFPTTKYTQCSNQYSFNMNPFPLYQNVNKNYFPNQGLFADIFIIEAQQAIAYIPANGYVFLNNHFIKETQIKNLNFFNGKAIIHIKGCKQGIKVPGRVAIISHLYPYCYFHWIFDVISQLALLEINNIQYDYIYTPYYLPFMKESLQIWGINPSKIIPINNDIFIQADCIILPTAVTSTIPCVINSNYCVDYIIKYVKEKMLSNIQNLTNPDSPQKIFLSRKDAPQNKRTVINEDEIFALFEPLGFKRYELTRLSQVEQISLFYNAKTIVSFMGSAAANILYCQPGTHYIDIFQKWIDATFFYLSDMCHLKYSYINASTEKDLIYGNPWSAPTAMPIDLVQKFIEEHPEL